MKIKCSTKIHSCITTLSYCSLSFNFFVVSQYIHNSLRQYILCVAHVWFPTLRRIHGMWLSKRFTHLFFSRAFLTSDHLSLGWLGCQKGHLKHVQSAFEHGRWAKTYPRKNRVGSDLPVRLSSSSAKQRNIDKPNLVQVLKNCWKKCTHGIKTNLFHPLPDLERS